MHLLSYILIPFNPVISSAQSGLNPLFFISLFFLVLFSNLLALFFDLSVLLIPSLYFLWCLPKLHLNGLVLLFCLVDLNLCLIGEECPPPLPPGKLSLPLPLSVPLPVVLLNLPPLFDVLLTPPLPPPLNPLLVQMSRFPLFPILSLVVVVCTDTGLVLGLRV